MLALAMSLFVTFGSVAAANTMDPYMIPYDQVAGGNYRYAIVLDPDESYVEITFGPAIKVGTEPNATYVPSYYNNAADAVNVDINFLTEDGIVSADVDYMQADNPNGQWITEAGILLPDDGSHGSITVMITNNNSGVVTNITIARNENNPPIPDVAKVSVWLSDPGSRTMYEADGINIPSNTFYENPNARTYPTGLDAILQTWYAQYITAITSISTEYTPGTGDFVKSITVGGSIYASEWDDGKNAWKGWRYMVYRVPVNDPTKYWRVRPSQDVGADCWRLFDEDLIVWKYGYLEDNTLFPDYYPVP
jgi:hypothetical protein